MKITLYKGSITNIDSIIDEVEIPVYDATLANEEAMKMIKRQQFIKPYYIRILYLENSENEFDHRYDFGSYTYFVRIYGKKLTDMTLEELGKEALSRVKRYKKEREEMKNK